MEGFATVKKFVTVFPTSYSRWCSDAFVTYHIRRVAAPTYVMADDKNRLYFADNLAILRNPKEIPDESVDLIYLDPPFNSNATYNVLFKEKSGEASAAQITAFDDTWYWGRESAEAYHEVVTQGPRKLGDLLQALVSFLGHNDMMAYVTMMAIRLVEMRRVLNSLLSG